MLIWDKMAGWSICLSCLSGRIGTYSRVLETGQLITPVDLLFRRLLRWQRVVASPRCTGKVPCTSKQFVLGTCIVNTRYTARNP